DVCLQLNRGDILGFLGPNGAGKSTVLRMLTGNLIAVKGDIQICGVDLASDPLAAKRRIGYLPEIPPIYKELTVDEYLRFAARLHGIPGKSATVAVEVAKKRCELESVGRKITGTLSKGFQQRVGIAQAIIHEPEVIILDEPTAGLDPNQIQTIRQLLLMLKQEHAIIFSTHILPEVESICNRVHILHQGKTMLDTNLDVLRQQNRNLGDAFAQLTQADATNLESA
ncbi:MAG: ABC transporter ATP-binding protein, partial [Nitrosomonas sp.]|nr:ABC transporter ATP-binding protein [Nitrosomonas sp.]